jgi:hypothetical protein
MQERVDFAKKEVDMSAWRQFVKKRRVLEGLSDDGDPVSKFKFNSSDDDFGEDYEKTQTELFKVILNKYPEETLDFFNTIANRGDEEVGALLKQMGNNRGHRLPQEPKHPTDGHEVVPSSADRGFNPAGDDGE